MAKHVYQVSVSASINRGIVSIYNFITAKESKEEAEDFCLKYVRDRHGANLGWGCPPPTREMSMSELSSLVEQLGCKIVPAPAGESEGGR